MRRSVFVSGSLWFAVLDVLCLVAAVALGIGFRQTFGPVMGLVPLTYSLSEYIAGHLDGWFYFCVTIVVSNYAVGSYDTQSAAYRFNLLVNWLFSLCTALLVVSATSYAWFELLLGRGVLVSAVMFYAALSLSAKLLVYELSPVWNPFVCRTVLLGAGKAAVEIRKVIESKYILPPHVVCGFIAVSGRDDVPADIGGVPVVSVGVKELENAVRGFNPDLLIMCSREWGDALPYCSILRRLRFSGIEVLDALSAAEIFSGRVPLGLVSDAWLMQASLAPSMAVVRRLKRMFDIAVAVVGAIILVPVGLFAALITKLGDPSAPAIYVQERVGQFGRIFRMYKLRTMIQDAEADGSAVLSRSGDPRVTRIGGILRRFRIDEIPQIWNVLRGNMSVVGPRPERLEFVRALEKKIRHYRERENTPPGLTGWAQVRFPYVDNQEDMARKLEYDLYYIKNMSIRLDMQIILRTIRIVLFGKERSV